MNRLLSNLSEESFTKILLYAHIVLLILNCLVYDGWVSAVGITVGLLSISLALLYFYGK